MFRSIKKFLTNTKGAFAMQFALMAIPLTVCTGLAIDGGRAFLARFELASALDAAALAVGSTLQEGADLDAIAAKFVNRNFRTEHDNPITLELVSSEDSITLKGEVTINTYFMPLVGQPYVTVSAESEVRRGGSNVEVALVLDITGSMNTTRMEGLTSAAKILIEEVVNPIQTPFFSKVAIAPWSASVHVGSTHVNSGVVEDLRGTLTGTTPISAANWRNGATTTKTITEAGWRTTAGGKTIANAGTNGSGGIDWRWGPSRSITGFTKVSSNTRIRVTTSANHGYSNGEFVRLTGITTGSYTALNNNIYLVADKTNTTFNLRNVGNTAYITPPAGTTSTTGASQRCHDSECNMGVTTTSAFTGLAAGDFVNITGTSGFPGSLSPNYINNSATTTWVVADVPSTTRFTLANWTPSTLFGTTPNAGGGTVSECLVSDCRYRVTTSAAHGFSTTDNVFIWGMTESGSGTAANSVVNTTWNVANPSGSVFYLPGNGKTYLDWSSGGSAAECALATCNVQITSASHGVAVDERVEIKSATGMTGINTCGLSSSGQCSSGSRLVWRISEVDGNVLTLADTSPSLSNMSGTYGSSGTLQCTRYGCNRRWFTNSSNNERVFRPTQCLVERYGDDAYNDADPATSPLGILYTGDGSCDTDNYVTPLTSDTTRLNTAIDALTTGGSTGGQLGMAWGWYMLSPNFASIWDKEPVNQPKTYTTPELAKVVVMMTDGEFNFATCSGVVSSTINSSICVPDDADDNTVGKHVAFKQAEALCAAMKAEDIIIYTVGLELDTALYSDDFLLKCASSPTHAFLADNNEELEDAFEDIAISISKLRIAR